MIITFEPERIEVKVLGDCGQWKPALSLHCNDVGHTTPEGIVVTSVTLRLVQVCMHTVHHSEFTLTATSLSERDRCLTPVPPDLTMQVTFDTTFERDAESKYNRRPEGFDRNVDMALYYKKNVTGEWQRAQKTNAVWLPHDAVSVRASLGSFYECVIAATRPKASGLQWFKSRHLSRGHVVPDEHAVVCNLMSHKSLYLSSYHIARRVKTNANGTSEVETLTSPIKQYEVKAHNPGAVNVLRMVNPPSGTTTVSIFVLDEGLIKKYRAIHSVTLDCGEMVCICNA